MLLEANPLLVLMASTFSPILLRASPRPTVTVVFPSPAAVGFIVGFLFLLLTNKIYTRISKKRNTKSMLFLALTIHNIPEGLAVGLAFGVALKALDPSYLVTAFGIALGIGIQNIPEGATLSLPLKEGGMSKKNASLYMGISAFGAAAVFIIFA